MKASTLESSSPFGFCLQMVLLDSGHSLIIVAMIVLPLLLICTQAPQFPEVLKSLLEFSGMAARDSILGRRGVGDVHHRVDAVAPSVPR